MPGVGETLDWAQALDALGHARVDAEVADRTLGALVKSREDLERLRRDGLAGLISRARERTG